MASTRISAHRAQIAFALRKVCRTRGIGVIYLATNRYSDIPLYNGSGARLFSLSDPREMTRTLAPYLLSHGWPADSDGTPHTLDNFVVSAIEQVPTVTGLRNITPSTESGVPCGGRSCVACPHSLWVLSARLGRTT